MLTKKQYCPLIWITTITLFTGLMFQIIAPYSTWQWDVDFLQTKQRIIHLDHYRIAFYAHIFSSLVILFSGAFLFVDGLLKKWPIAHRWIGKTYVFLLLVIAAPSGFVMAFYANGGWMAQLSFLILTPLWWWFTFKGLQTARLRNFKAHQIWMRRSYALTLSAITLRFMQMGLGHYSYLDPELQYVLVSWGSWIFNLAVLEIWNMRKFNLYFKSLKLVHDGV